ncbi:inducible alternative oxidase 2 [Thecaphora frezii]
MFPSTAIALATRSPMQLRQLQRSSVLVGVGALAIRNQRHLSTSIRLGSPQHVPAAQSPSPALGSTGSSLQPSAQSKAAVEGAQAKTNPRDVVYGEKHPSKSYLLFHPVYSQSDLDSVKVVHRKAQNMGDRIAARMVWLARSIFDIATRYPGYHNTKFPPIKGASSKRVDLPRHIADQKDWLDQLSKDGAVVQVDKASQLDVKNIEEGMTLEEMRKKGIVFGPDGWMNRMIFLETIAGVPGMVAATCRHLQSLRLMKRDKGWIHTMLEDAENERMHLLTFMAIAKPGIIARTFALLAQGVFYNFFFVFYLISPRVAHRFVGVLEEEAVHTYSLILDDMEAGRLPEWEDLPAPEIAKEYWQLKPDAKFEDVIRAVRADEATHRHINHTFASLESSDPNPFAYREAPAKMRGASYGLERQEALEWAKKGEDEALESAKKTA